VATVILLWASPSARAPTTNAASASDEFSRSCAVLYGYRSLPTDVAVALSSLGIRWRYRKTTLREKYGFTTSPSAVPAAIEASARQ
jgi:hypothetical protein